MADQASSQEKTEKATPKRMEEARKKGNVGKSQELPSASVLISGLLTLGFTASMMYAGLSEIFIGLLGNAASIRLDSGDGMEIISGAIVTGVKIVMPIMAVVFIAAVLVNFAQVGPLLTFQPLQPKFSKINPFKGMKKFFSLRIVADLIKNVLKLVAVGFVAYKTVEGEMDQLGGLAGLSLEQIVVYIISVCFKIFLRCALLILAIAFLDFVYQRWQYMKNLRMSKQEVRDEYKQREGDPMVKSRIRSIQRKMAQKRMMEAVPQADVVITNPTHLAVALAYQSGEAPAPKVVAKGADLMAKRIRELAEEYGIPIVEEKPLAWALFKLEVGQVIPEDLYQAVAKVLAYVYQLKRRKAGLGR